jgi:hypothetical protein
MSSTMNEAPENSGQTEQAAPTAPASSQTTNPEQNQWHGVGTTMNWIMLLTAGFCLVVAGLLSNEATSRAAISASIQDVESVVSEAFPSWGRGGLGEHDVRGDWWGMTVGAKKESRVIIDRFHAVLQNEDRVLTHISKVARAAADEGSGKAHGSDIPIITSDFNKLEERRGVCQRMLNSLSILNQTGYEECGDFHVYFDFFKVNQRNQLNMMINLSLPNDDAKEGEPVQATGAGELFQLAINRVKKAISKASGHLNPEQTSFVRALHMERAAASMYNSVVGIAINRYEELSETIKVERTWFERNVQEWLESRSLPESECPTTTEGLQTALEEIVALADKWRGKLHELYSN